MIYSLLIAHNLSDLVAKRRRGRTFPDFFSLWIALQPSGPSFFVCQCEATIHHCHHHHQHDHALILTCSQNMNEEKLNMFLRKNPPSLIFWPNFGMNTWGNAINAKNSTYLSKLSSCYSYWNFGMKRKKEGLLKLFTLLVTETYVTFSEKKLNLTCLQ